jgi:D-tyrosyl-tRNA(Tyr) deacylase
MRAVVQRVSGASVAVVGAVIGSIAAGLCVLVGVTHDDEQAHAAKLAEKLWGLRIFEDEHGAMNRSAADVGGEVLVVSQFTLYGDATRGRRPSFVAAAPGPVAEPLVDAVVEHLRSLGATVATGRFGADMAVSLINDGPVTILLEVPAAR